jgi:hypothetical protein
MTYSLLFAAALILVLIVKYCVPKKERCPQCFTPRDPDHPLCAECGWIYDVPGEEDDDYGELEKEEPF